MQVMDALPDWIGELEVRLGHRALLEAALVNARVPKVGFSDQLYHSECPHQLLDGGSCGCWRSHGLRSVHLADPKRQHAVQELRGSALQLLATGLAVSPRVSGARSEHWPSIKIALEGLGLPAGAVSACKIWLLQVRLLP